jgi:hypothetical protein
MQNSRNGTVCTLELTNRTEIVIGQWEDSKKTDLTNEQTAQGSCLTIRKVEQICDANLPA